MTCRPRWSPVRTARPRPCGWWRRCWKPMGCARVSTAPMASSSAASSRWAAITPGRPVHARSCAIRGCRRPCWKPRAVVFCVAAWRWSTHMRRSSPTSAPIISASTASILSKTWRTRSWWWRGRSAPTDGSCSMPTTPCCARAPPACAAKSRGSRLLRRMPTGRAGAMHRPAGFSAAACDYAGTKPTTTSARSTTSRSRWAAPRATTWPTLRAPPSWPRRWVCRRQRLRR